MKKILLFTIAMLVAIGGNTKLQAAAAQPEGEKSTDNEGRLCKAFSHMKIERDLFRAVVVNDINTVKDLVSAGVDVDSQDNEESSLYKAVYEGFTEISQILIAAGASTDKVNAFGYTPLTRAVLRGDAQIVQSLLDAGASIDIKNNHERTPLHLAVMGGYIEIVKILLAERASVDIPDYHKNTPLSLAVMDGYIEIVKILLAAGVSVDVMNCKGDTPLSIAVNKGYTEIEKLLRGE